MRHDKWKGSYLRGRYSGVEFTAFGKLACRRAIKSLVAIGVLVLVVLKVVACRLSREALKLSLTGSEFYCIVLCPVCESGTSKSAKLTNRNSDERPPVDRVASVGANS